MLPLYTPSGVVGRMVISPPTLKGSPGTPELVSVTVAGDGASAVKATEPPEPLVRELEPTRMRTTALFEPCTLYSAVTGVPEQVRLPAPQVNPPAAVRVTFSPAAATVPMTIVPKSRLRSARSWSGL